VPRGLGVLVALAVPLIFLDEVSKEQYRAASDHLGRR